MKATRSNHQTATKRVVKILVVDDHELIRRGLTQLIEAEEGFEVCGEASTAPDAVRLVREEKPDFVVVDLSLSEGSGLELIKDIRSLDEDVKVLVVSMHDDQIFAERALRAGAQGYLNKAETSERFMSSVRRIMDGRIALSPAMSERMMRRAIGQQSPSEVSPIETLTDRELEVLELIGHGMRTRDVAEQLHLSIKTIDTYREHLKEKLSLSSANELMHYAVAYVLNKT